MYMYMMRTFTCISCTRCVAYSDFEAVGVKVHGYGNTNSSISVSHIAIVKQRDTSIVGRGSHLYTLSQSWCIISINSNTL